jgi:hypothetical protein
MNDEAHFHLSGYANKQNFRYWSDINLRQLHQKPLHSSKVTVWCTSSSSINFIPLLNNKNIHLFENVACSQYGQSPLTQLLNIIETYMQ